MKDIYQLLREKEQQIEQLKKEVEALRTVAALLADQPESSAEDVLGDHPGPVKVWR